MTIVSGVGCSGGGAIFDGEHGGGVVRRLEAAVVGGVVTVEELARI
jgi:hypothetical protein